MACVRIAALAVALALGFAAGNSAAKAATDRPAAAVDKRATDPSAQARRARPRIEIRPGRLLYRECVDGYREVWRPGWRTYVVTPYMRCWWVRG